MLKIIQLLAAILLLKCNGFAYAESSHPMVKICDDDTTVLVNNYDQFSFLSLFDEPEAFDFGTFVFSGAIALRSNNGISFRNSVVQVPPLTLILEYPIAQNIGIGLSGGFMRWFPNKESNTVYSYYTLSPRAAYHINLGDAFDLYAGISINGRMVTAGARNSSNSINRKKIDVSPYLGLRYYFTNVLGAFLELGGDGTGCFKAGFALRINH